MEKKHFVILFAVIAILALSGVVSASEQNDVGVYEGVNRGVDIKSGSFEAGEHTLKKRYGVWVWNLPDRSGESIKEIRIIFAPQKSETFKRVDVWGEDILESKDPYTIVGRNIPVESGLGINIETGAEEKGFVPVSIKRDTDKSYFETMGTQLVTVTATPTSNIDWIEVNIRLKEDRPDYQEIADVKLLSTSKDYLDEIYEEEWVRFVVRGAEEGNDYVFKVELQITPKEEKASYIPGVVIHIVKQSEDGGIVDKGFEKSTKLGTFIVQSAEEVNFHPMDRNTLSVNIEGISTTRRFLEERPTATKAPTSASKQAQPVLPSGGGDIDWEQVGVILAIIGATIGGLLSRRKRSRVKKLLDDIDKAYEGFKMNSRRCEAELYQLRNVVSEHLKNGKINEDSYSILDKRIDDYLGEIRERIMEEKVGKVPSRMKDEVHRMLEDGEISEDEYKAFENILGKSKDIGKKEKSELKGLFKKWKDEDKVTGSVLEKYIDEYMEDIGKVDGKVSGIELKAEIDKIMEDGIVTHEEYEEFSKMLDSSDLNEEEKEGLKRKLRKIRDLSNK